MPSSNITIRRLMPPDAFACRTLRLRGLQESPTSFGSSYEEECEQTLATTEAFLTPGSGRNTFGAFDGEQLVGMAGVGRESGLKQRHKAFLRGVYLMPEYRGRGIAKRLISHALQFAASMPGVLQITLTANAGNADAVRLYEKFGFTIYGREPGGLLVDGQLHDEVLMVCKIGSIQHPN